MLNAFTHVHFDRLLKLPCKLCSCKLPNLLLRFINVIKHFFKDRKFRFWSIDKICCNLLCFFSGVFSVSHKNQIVLVLVRLQKIHQALVIYCVIEIWIYSTMFIQIPKTIIIWLFDVQKLSWKLPVNFGIFQENHWIIQLRYWYQIILWNGLSKPKIKYRYFLLKSLIGSDLFRN